MGVILKRGCTMAKKKKEEKEDLMFPDKQKAYEARQEKLEEGKQERTDKK